MKGLTKLATKIGMLPVAILAMGISAVVLFVSFNLEQQGQIAQQNETQAQMQQGLAKLVQERVTGEVQRLNERLASVANSASLDEAIAGGLFAIQQKQTELKSVFSQAQNVCLFSAEVDQPDQSACIPISFATLTSLRQAKENGHADMAVMSVNTDNAHLMLAQRILDSSGNAVGVLVVTYPLEVVKQLISKELGNFGYVELSQANVKLASSGDSSLKQATPTLTRAISGSHFSVGLWLNTATQESSLPIIMMAAIVLTILMMLLILLWASLVVKADANTLIQLVDDYQNSKLKPQYRLANKAFQSVVDSIKTLGRQQSASVTASPEKQAAIKPTPAPEPKQEISVSSSPLFDPSIFKMNDIRGVVGTSIDETSMLLLGQALGSQALQQDSKRFVVARDGRLSSENLSKAFVEGLVSTGCSVVDIGVVPTPLMYFACNQFGFSSGAVITASHNPAQYNGVKIVLGGTSLSGDKLKSLHKWIEDANFVTGEGSYKSANVIDDYIKRITKDVKLARPMKVVVDAGNGVAGPIAPQLLHALGCDVVELYCDVDGRFPNHSPDPSDSDNLNDLRQSVSDHGAELGIAFDGDGDRIAVVDGNGKSILPDRLMVLFSQDILTRQPGATILYDVKSTTLLNEAIKHGGGKPVLSPSGHSIIKQKMKDYDAQLAGELSGHIFFKERWFGFDDGIYAAVRLLELLADDPLERTPTEVFESIPERESTPEIIIEMEEGENYKFMEALIAEAKFEGAQVSTVDGIRANYATGWGLVRASNTMPALTLRFEANTSEKLQFMKQQFKQQMLQVKPTLTLDF
jgi:phosphomannomutase/phosphoglucomutase